MITKRQERAIREGREGSVAAGEISRGLPTSPFEAVSFNIHSREYIRTRHTDESKAMRRLHGNPSHTQRHMIDHNERKDAGGRLLPLRVVRLED